MGDSSHLNIFASLEKSDRFNIERWQTEAWTT